MRIAVLPFSNLDGNLELNKYGFELQDSLTRALKTSDLEENNITVVPAEEIIAALKEMNVDASNPNFDGNKWDIVPNLNVDKIVSGNFRIVGSRFLINAYIYYPQTQLSDPDFQAKDIFRREDKVLDAVPIIVRQLSRAWSVEE